MTKSKELKKWEEVKKLHSAAERITLGPHYSHILRNDPRRMLFMLSHYKFAAKLIGKNKYVLEIGCSEGLGATLLAESAKMVMGIDIDEEAVKEARRSFGSEKIKFSKVDFLNAKFADIFFDAAVALDVIEHIYPENENIFFLNVSQSLKKDGICVIGTPNKAAEQHASSTSKAGHVNLYTWERLREAMEKYFRNVFIFSANDEIIHTGFYPMAHYLIALGVGKK
jgi:2-polyprenyl-3-methyl-5-hydroxy-6-metoxy-1,4-benzoquinol methylase